MLHASVQVSAWQDKHFQMAEPRTQPAHTTTSHRSHDHKDPRNASHREYEPESPPQYAPKPRAERNPSPQTVPPPVAAAHGRPAAPTQAASSQLGRNSSEVGNSQPAQPAAASRHEHGPSSSMSMMSHLLQSFNSSTAPSPEPIAHPSMSSQNGLDHAGGMLQPAGVDPENVRRSWEQVVSGSVAGPSVSPPFSGKCSIRQ